MHRLLVGATVLEHELSEVRLLVERRAGVLLHQSSEAVSSLLIEHIEARQYPSTETFLTALRESGAELEAVLETLLDATSGFGRHANAFRAFRYVALPEIRQKKLENGSHNFRIWSAGCATGEEAYSIAIALTEAIEGDPGWNVQVVGSDIRRNALQVAERGLYPESDFKSMSQSLLHKYFSRVGDHLLVKARLRNMVAFTPMNLVQPAFLGRYDCIFCMDVLPHFSMAQRIALANQFQLYLEPGGYLLLGDGEKLPVAEIALEVCSDPGLYRKPKAAAAGR